MKHELSNIVADLQNLEQTKKLLVDILQGWSDGTYDGWFVVEACEAIEKQLETFGNAEPSAVSEVVQTLSIAHVQLILPVDVPIFLKLLAAPKMFENEYHQYFESYLNELIGL